MDDEDGVEGVYLDGDQLVVLTSSAWWGHFGASFAAIEPWAGERHGVRLLDLTDPRAIEETWRIDLEGALVASRRIGDRLLLVSRHFPSVEGLDLAPVDSAAQASNQARLDELTASELLPRISINGIVDEGLLSGDRCLVSDPAHPEAPDSPGYPVLTTIVALDLESRAVTDALCYTEPVDGVYVSPTAVYLAYSPWGLAGNSSTIVHRFTHGAPLRYAGSGRVDGILAGGAQPDFRMSEADDHLRLLTTEFTGDDSDAFDHRLFVLAQDSEAPALRRVAELPSPDRPEEIGKNNEDVYGVRFLGDRAYVVTFERVDPLYVLDLGDPRDPRILGQVELPGFSDFLHPVSDGLLLGLGDDGEGHIKVELFDVSTPEQPLSRGSLLLAEDAAWAFSDARYDRRAFTSLSLDDGRDRLAVPVSADLVEGAPGEERYRNEQRLYLFELAQRGSPGAARLRLQGVLTAPTATGFGLRQRSVLHDEAVYFITGSTVWSAFWFDPAQLFGPF